LTTRPLSPSFPGRCPPEKRLPESEGSKKSEEEQMELTIRLASVPGEERSGVSS